VNCISLNLVGKSRRVLVFNGRSGDHDCGAKIYQDKGRILNAGQAVQEHVTSMLRVVGNCRDTFYWFQEPYELGSEVAFNNESRQNPVLKNRVLIEFELVFPFLAFYKQELVASVPSSTGV